MVFARLDVPPLLMSPPAYLQLAVPPVFHTTVGAVLIGTKNLSAKAITEVLDPSTEPKHPLPASWKYL
jgi:hypothetical protein